MDDQAFGIADGGQMTEQVQLFDELDGSRLSAPDAKTDQGALSPRHVFVHHMVGGRRGQPGITNPFDSRVVFQKAGHLERIGGMALHAQR